MCPSEPCAAQQGGDPQVVVANAAEEKEAAPEQKEDGLRVVEVHIDHDELRQHVHKVTGDALTGMRTDLASAGDSLGGEKPLVAAGRYAKLLVKAQQLRSGVFLGLVAAYMKFDELRGLPRSWTRFRGFSTNHKVRCAFLRPTDRRRRRWRGARSAAR